MTSPGELANGPNVLRAWLEDGLYNYDWLNFSTTTLYFDNIPPTSNVIASSVTNSTSSLNVGSQSLDPGASAFPQTGSGVSATVLWQRKDSSGNGIFGPWQQFATSNTGTSGQFAVPLGGEGNYEFYSQAFDIAGNFEAAPSSATIAKAGTLVDWTPPRTNVLLDGTQVTAGTLVVTSTDALSLVAIDTGSGVGFTLYAIDGSTPILYASTFSIVGTHHLLTVQSVDAAGNVEGLQSIALVTPGPPVPTSIVPDIAGNGGALAFSLSGSAFSGGSTVKLSRTNGAPGFANTGTLSTPRDNAAAVRLPNGKVLIAGGESSNGSTLASAELYDPVTGTWTPTGTMTAPRIRHTMVLLKSGLVLSAGGISCSNCNVQTNTAEVYDPTSGQWTAVAPMNQTRANHTATLLPDGRILVAGGIGNSGSTIFATGEIYDPATGSWTEIGGMSSGHSRHAAALAANGTVIVAGGANQQFNYTAAVDIFNPATNQWSTGASMPSARGNFTIVPLATGKILFPGGDNGQILRAVDLYDPAANAWTAANPMPIPRFGFTLTPLGNGTVLMVGGFDSNATYLNPLLYNPLVDSWTSAGVQPRFGHSAALLGNGNVLVAGGYNNIVGEIGPAALYTPASLIVVASSVVVQSPNQIAGAFDLTGAPAGKWDVVVTNPDGQSGALPAAFTVHDVTPPTPVIDLSFTVVATTAAVVTWTAPSGQGGTVSSYDLRRATFPITAVNFQGATSVPAPAPTAPGTLQTASIPLNSDASVFVAIRSLDLYGDISNISDVAAISRSTASINGMPEAAVWATQPVYLVPSADAAAVSAAAAAQGLTPVSNFYDPTPQAVPFAKGANAGFSFDPAILSAQGVATGSLHIYQLVGGSLVALSSQTVAGQTITASTASFAGALGLFGVVPPPALNAIAPNLASNAGPVSVSAGGSGIVSGAILSLNRSSSGNAGFAPVNPMITPRTKAAVVRLPNGKVLVSGGQGINTNIVYASAEIYDPATGNWAATGSMGTARFSHTMTLLPNGKVLVAGGSTCDSCHTALNTAELYDPASGTWSYTSPLAAVRIGHTATLLSNGKVLVAGGGSSNNAALIQPGAELYDPQTGTWASAGNMPSGAHFSHAAAALADGRVAIAGGVTSSLSMTAAIDIYDPAANSWSPAASMSTPRISFTLNLLPNGTLLAVGGDNGTILSSVEVFSPATGTWSPAAPLGFKRAYHTSARLTDGTILVVGGADGAGGFPGAAESYDPATGRWSTVGTLPVLNNAETLLTDGRVLVAGGFNSSGLSTPAIYNPASLSIVASSMTYSGGNGIGGVLDLSGQPTGLWDVVVTNPNRLSARLSNGFTVFGSAPPSAVADLAVTAILDSTAALQWTAPASPSGALASFEIRYSTMPLTAANFAAGTLVPGPAPAPSGVAQSAAVGGLGGLTAFYAGLRSHDAYGNVSALSNIASFVRSTVTIGAQAEITFSANIAVTETLLSTATAPGSVVLATATAQGLTLVSSIYDLGPEGAVFNPSAKLTFAYSAASLAALGLAPSDLTIYQYVSGVGMVAVSSQTVDMLAGTITGYVPSLSSIFAVFGRIKDRTPPVTAFVPGAVETFTDAAGNLYASSTASFGFNAFDPIVFGTAAGVAYTDYRVDGPSTAPFQPYASTFTLPGEGAHVVHFFSADYAGNIEVARSSGVLVDSTPPTSTPQVVGSSASVLGVLVVSSSTLFSLSAADPISNGVASGVGGIFYVVDADPASPACAAVPADAGAASGTCANEVYAGPFVLSPGAHTIYYFAEDNVVNAEAENVLSVFVDTIAPLTVLLVDGSTATVPGIVLVSTDSLSLLSSDAGSGVAQTLYSLDGAAEQVYASSFAATAGSHTLAYRSIDRVGNAEVGHQVALNVILYDATPPAVALTVTDGSTITTNSPVIAAVYGDGGRGVDASSVRLTLDGVDVTTQASVTASSTTFAPVLPQGTHILTLSLADLAGNPASATARFFVDSLPPMTLLQVDGVTRSTSPIVVVSSDSFSLSASDAGTGVAQTLYAIDGGAPTVYGSTFSLATGTHTLAYHSVDKAGNVEATHDALLTVLPLDLTPPTATLAPPTGSTVTTTTPQIVAVYSDSGRGVDVSSVRLSLDGQDVTSAAAVSASSAVFVPSAFLSQATHTAVIRVDDLVGNQTISTSVFLVDSLPPVTTLIIDGLSASTTNLVVVSTDSLGFSATDSGTGVARTLYSLDGANAAVYSSTFSLTVGTHSVAFRSMDAAGNAELARNALIEVLAFDAAPPTVSLQPVNGSTVTTTTPTIVAAYGDAGRGVDLASVRFALDGVDVTTAAMVGLSSATFVPRAALAQSLHVAVVTLADRAGNPAVASSVFLVDSLPPVTSLLVDGLAASTSTIVLTSTDTLGFAAVDTGAGVERILYALDGAAASIYASTFSISGGTHALAYQSLDRTGNMEPLRTAYLTVRSTITAGAPPQSSLFYPAPTALGVEQAVGGVVSVRGAASSGDLRSWTLAVAPGVAASTGFATIASGAGNVSGVLADWNTASVTGAYTLRLSAVDGSGASATSIATVFIGAPVMDFAIGKRASDAVVSDLKNPQGIVVRPDGLIWVAVDDDARLLLVSPAGTVVATVGAGRGRGDDNRDDRDGGHGRDARTIVLKHPRGLSLDMEGHLFVADRDQDRVVELSSDGAQVLAEFSSGLKEPNDAVVDADGSVFVADTGHARVRVFARDGSVRRDIPTATGGRDSQPWGLALSSRGLWVSDRAKKTVLLFSRDGVLLKTIAGAGRVRGAAVDPVEALYAVDRGEDLVRKYDPDGAALLAFGSRGRVGEAERRSVRVLSDPADAAIAPDGALWVADSGHDRIVRFVLPAAAPAARGGHGLASLGTSAATSANPKASAARILDAGDGGKVERDDGAGVSIPAGAMTASLELSVQTAASRDEDAKRARAFARKVQPASDEVEYGPEGTLFQAPVTITIPYEPAQLALAGVKEDRLQVHYWNPSSQDWEPLASAVDKTAHTVSAQTTHFSVYQLMGAGGGISVAAADPGYGLRAAYAFPNPVHSGAVTIRIQPGQADSVSVRIYDVSGRKVHESSDFTLNPSLDDGNGLGAQYTYDHAWDVSGAASGVYTYVITAKKAGQADIHRTGRVGVSK